MYGTSQQPLYSPNARQTNSLYQQPTQNAYNSPQHQQHIQQVSTTLQPQQPTFNLPQRSYSTARKKKMEALEDDYVQSEQDSFFNDSNDDDNNNSNKPRFTSSFIKATEYHDEVNVFENEAVNNMTEEKIDETNTEEHEHDLFTSWDLKTSIRSGEQQTKVVSENIDKVESHFPHIVQDINLYTVRSAKLRDAGDNFSKSLREYATSETPVLQRGLSAFAECFAAVQDHRNVLVNRLENKVVNGFSVYETKCKQAKLDVRQHTVAHSKELNQHKSYERVKGKSTQQFQLAKAEAKFKKAAEEANRSAQILNDQVSDFERQKVRDLKKCFGEFMLSEMLFYAKALEIYTRGYQELMEIDEEENVTQLQESMKFTPHQFGQQSLYGGSAPSLMQTNLQQQSTSPQTHQFDRTL